MVQSISINEPGCWSQPPLLTYQKPKLSSRILLLTERLSTCLGYSRDDEGGYVSVCELQPRKLYSCLPGAARVIGIRRKPDTYGLFVWKGISLAHKLCLRLESFGALRFSSSS